MLTRADGVRFAQTEKCKAAAPPESVPQCEPEEPAGNLRPTSPIKRSWSCSPGPHKVWHTIYHKVTSGQSLLFLCALALNLTASTITATVALFLLTTRGRDWLMGRIRRDTITVAASQRITQRTTAQTWRLNATLVDSPHGVLLRLRLFGGQIWGLAAEAVV